MKKQTQSSTIKKRARRVKILLVFLGLLLFLFLFSIFKTISNDRRLPSHTTTIHDRAFRGSIISADHYTLSSSKKNYKAVIRGASLKPAKRALFIKLFSIYSGISQAEIHEKLLDKEGHYKTSNIILSKTLTTDRAMQLKALGGKLRRLGVFQSLKTRSGVQILFGLDIIEVGEYRRFPLHDVLSPVLGYMGKIDDGKYIRPKGMKGLEAKYNTHITAKKDGFFQGKRDVLGVVIHDKNSISSERVDGMDLHLNISLDVQRRIEYMLDEMKEKLDADQIMAGVMESHSGKVLALATSERYDPSHIHQKDVYNLNPKFSEYPYEPGSVIKPLTLAIALDHKVVKADSWFQTGYKNFDITGGRHINDDEFFSDQTATDIIVHSSNIGISQIAWRVTGKEFREGLLKFGLAQKSGLDLSRDLTGFMKSEHLLNHKMHRANSSFGYGMTATFAQLLKAYAAFNNGGIAVTPRIVNYLQDTLDGKHYTLNPKLKDQRAISKQSATQIHTILKEVVKRGTGAKARYPGLEIGGKTGTAYIAEHGHYTSDYHSSFYGFANDKKGHTYTIGVFVIRAKKPYAYFASASAVPTFKNIVKILVNQDYLVPDAAAVAAYEKAHAKPIPKPKVAPKIWETKKKPLHKKSIKSLFKANKKHTGKKHTKKKKKKSSYKKPLKQKSANELFEDLF